MADAGIARVNAADHAGTLTRADLSDVVHRKLGLSRADVLKQLRAGRSITDIARAQGKSLDDVKAAITTAVTKELDQQVADRKLTADQETKILGELKDHLDDLVNHTRPAAPNGPPQFGPRHHWR